MAKDIARDIKEYNFIEKIEEELLPYSDDSLYNITSFGTDLTFREIITMYEENDLVKPDLQRNYVWSKNEASRFIDSILLGLPVPSIFLAKAQDGRRLIVDGFQRIMTVYDYIKGVFRGDGKVFKLSKSETVNARWRGKAYTELTAEEQRNIKLSPIHAIIFEQKEPQDDTGMYQIFERINTGGRVLKPQEIRNCIYHGKFNETLKELNKEKIWRIVLGNPNEEARMFDIELILRFFAFSYIKKYFRKNKISQISLIKYLNEYMSLYSNASENDLSYMRKIFKKVIKFLNEKIGDNVFRTFKRNDNVLKFANKINPVVFDSISAATVFVLENNKININKIDNLYDKYISLLENIDYINITKVRTTNVENIKKRISIACDVLYGVQYEW